MRPGKEALEALAELKKTGCNRDAEAEAAQKAGLLLVDEVEVDVDTDLIVDVERQQEYGGWTQGGGGVKRGSGAECSCAMVGKRLVSTTRQVMLGMSSAHYCPPPRPPRLSREMAAKLLCP